MALSAPIAASNAFGCKVGMALSAPIAASNAFGAPAAAMAMDVIAANASASVTSVSLDKFTRQEQQDFMLTQTQPNTISSQHMRAALMQQDQGVHARLISLTDPGVRFELRKDQQQVEIGRHPDCDITVKDQRVSGKHARIYRDESMHYFVEVKSNNGCWLNEHLMKKGDTRALQHGDEISLCVHAHASEEKPFAAYIFRLASNDSDSSGRAQDAQTNSREVASATTPPTTRNAPLRNHVSEQWVQERWDMRVVLGSGNFSEVRLGVEVATGNKRAVKVVDKKKFYSFQNKRESHLELDSEAEVLLSLNHGGIVGMHEYFQTDEKLCLVMDLLDGGDLLQCILESGCFPENAARRLFRELCDAVAYLHKRHVVHRDLKPENILLTTKDRDEMHVKIADFGLARKNMQSRDCRTFCGTPHYFAPEVINTFRERESGQPSGYGKQADMWSLGVILYIMLSGIPPFEEDGLYEQILEGKYEFDVCEWTTVSPEAKELVRRLMTVNPKDRLTIQQALDHPWFRIPSRTSSPRVRPPVPECRAVPMQLVEGEPSSKRPRTCDDAVMVQAATGVKDSGPLGA